MEETPTGWQEQMLAILHQFLEDMGKTLKNVVEFVQSEDPSAIYILFDDSTWAKMQVLSGEKAEAFLAEVAEQEAEGQVRH